MRLHRVFRVLRADCLLAAALLSIAAASPAVAARWGQATPFGGGIVALAQAPSAPRTLYAVAQNGRVFRSLDDGATWHRRGDGPRAVAGIVVDPGDAQTVYAYTGNYPLFRTRDGGATWSQIAPDLDVTALAADKGHRGVLFASALDGLYRSDDGGDSWRPAAAEGLMVFGVTADPRAADSFFAVVRGASSNEVWKSTDRGATWTSAVIPVTMDAPSGIPPHFAFDPVRPEVLYLLFTEIFSSGPLLRSSDGGASWSQLFVEGLRDITVAPDGTLFAASEYGLERSSDGGVTWVPAITPGALPPGGPPIDALTRLLVSSATPGELFAAGASGLWKSGDNGASWTLSNHGLLAQGAHQVAVPPTGPPAVLTLAGPSLSRSADQGATWTRLHAVLDGAHPDRIEAFDPRDPQTIYGITRDQADFPVVSTDGGRQWSELEFPFNCHFADSVCEVHLTMVALDHQDPASILVGGWYYYHFLGGGNFLFRSPDGGQTWKKLAAVAGIRNLVIDPIRRDTYHTVACRGLFRSTDAGASWKRRGLGLPHDLCFAALVIDPRDPLRFYVGTPTKGVFTSADGGATFHAMSRGLENAWVVSLLIDPGGPSKLYAGVAKKGVFRWKAGQRKWAPLNNGLPLTDFTGEVAIDPQHPSLLYAASPVEGVFRLDLEDSAP